MSWNTTVATRWKRYTFSLESHAGYYDTVVMPDGDFRTYEAMGWMVIWVGVDSVLLFKTPKGKSLACWLYLRETG